MIYIYTTNNEKYFVCSRTKRNISSTSQDIMSGMCIMHYYVHHMLLQEGIPQAYNKHITGKFINTCHNHHVACTPQNIFFHFSHKSRSIRNLAEIIITIFKNLPQKIHAQDCQWYPKVAKWWTEKINCRKPGHVCKILTFFFFLNGQKDFLKWTSYESMQIQN